MAPLPRRIAALGAMIALAAVPATLGACGADEEAPGGAPARVRVAATTGIAADIVRQVGGEDVEVEQIVPDSSNPHSYQLSARDRAAVEQADLVVAFGRNLEAGLDLAAAGPVLLELAEHAGGAPAGTPGDPDGGHDHEHVAHADTGEKTGDDAHDGHDHGTGTDPHVWTDPLLVAAALPAVAAAFGEADPRRAAAFERRAAAYARRLRALDGELREILAPVPADRRRLVASHDTMRAFADRYGFEIVGTAFGRSPAAEASAADLAELTERVRAAKVPVVFAQATDDPQVLRQVASETGVEVVDDLLVEGFGEGVDSYEELLRHDARRIAEALGR